MKALARKRKTAGRSPLTVARKEFQAKMMPYIMAMFNKCNAYGIDWRNIPPSQLSAHIILAEEFSGPEPMEVAGP